MLKSNHLTFLPEGRGTGSGAQRRGAEPRRAIRKFLTASLERLDTVQVHVIGPVQNAGAISRHVEFSVIGFSAVIENNNAQHALAFHSNKEREAKRGQLPVSRDDLYRVAQLLSEFDRAEKGNPTKQGTPRVRLFKRIDRVDYEVIVEVRKSARQVAFKTMIKRTVR